MSYKVIATDNFARELKKLVKKYPLLKEPLLELSTSLSARPAQGVAIGNDCYKIRISSPDKPSGKSGGFRIVTYVAYKNDRVYLLSVYDKSQVANIKDSELKALLKVLGN